VKFDVATLVTGDSTVHCAWYIMHVSWCIVAAAVSVSFLCFIKRVCVSVIVEQFS